MAIAFVAAADGDNVADSNFLNIAVPAGNIDGHVMVLAASQRGNFTAISWPAQAGWTLIREDDEATHFSQAFYYRVASSEPASYNFSLATNGKCSGGILTFSGVNTSSPVDAHGSSVFTADTTSGVAPSISPVGSDDMLICAFCTEYQDDNVWTPPGSMVERVERKSHTGTSNSGTTIEICTELLAASGPTGTRTATSTISTHIIAQSLALKSASAISVKRLLGIQGVGR